MQGQKYIKELVEDIHSATVATIATDGHPQTRIIDMMLWDEEGVYFLTARGKEFYAQLMEQKFVAISATKAKRAVSLRGSVKNIHHRLLDEIFEKNPYMKQIYPNDSREVLEVFCLYEAQGEYFDISDPSHVIRKSLEIGKTKTVCTGYFIKDNCSGCRKCKTVCPQRCINVETIPAVIDQDHCLHCGRCVGVCPVQAIEHRT